MLYIIPDLRRQNYPGPGLAPAGNLDEQMVSITCLVLAMDLSCGVGKCLLLVTLEADGVRISVLFQGYQVQFPLGLTFGMEQISSNSFAPVG